MNIYFNSILKAIIFFPILAFILTIPYMIIQYHKYGALTKKRILIVYSFIFYLLCTYFLVILPLPDKDIPGKIKYNLKLFEFVNDLKINSTFNIHNPKTYISLLTNNRIIEPLFNVLLTIPFGIYLKYYFKKSFFTTIFYSFLLSLFFEITQLTGLYYIYSSPYRLFDVNDLFTNTLGGLIGYLISPIFEHFLPTKEQLDEEALTKGKKVSFSRRAIAYFIDLFFISVILFILKNHLNFLLIFYIITLYFSIIPLFNNQTLGKKIVNIKYNCNNKFFIFFRGILYNGLFLNNTWLLIYLKKYFNYSNTLIILVQITCYIILIFNIIVNKYHQTSNLFIDKILKIEITDTIKHEETYIIKL